MKHLNTFERFLNEKEANESLIEAVKFNFLAEQLAYPQL